MHSDSASAPADNNVRIRFRFFARYAELLGTDRHEARLPRGTTVGAAVQELRAQLPGGDGLPAAPMAAVNQRHVGAGHLLADGDELALLPPLAGG